MVFLVPVKPFHGDMSYDIDSRILPTSSVSNFQNGYCLISSRERCQYIHL